MILNVLQDDFVALHRYVRTLETTPPVMMTHPVPLQNQDNQNGTKKTTSVAEKNGSSYKHAYHDGTVYHR